MGCSSAWPARLFWRVARESAWLNGESRKETRNEERFEILAGRDPRYGTGPFGRSGHGAVGPAEVLSGGDRGGQGDPDDQERRCDVRRRRARPGREDQERADPAEPQLPEGPQRGRADRRPAARWPSERDRRRHGADLCQRVHRAGAEGSRHLLQVAARTEADQRRTARHWSQHGLHELLGPELLRDRDGQLPRRDAQAWQGNLTVPI